jgi:hypothetical protein
MAAAVCICLQSAFDSGLLNEPRLLELAAAAELRVRKVTTAVADLMVCKAGSTLAFMLWRGGAAADDTAVRVARMAGSFKQAYVLVPHEHLRTPAVLEAAARWAGRLPLLCCAQWCMPCGWGRLSAGPPAP